MCGCLGVGVLGCRGVVVLGCGGVHSLIFAFGSILVSFFVTFSMILVGFEVHFMTFLVSGWSLEGIKASSGAPWGSLGRQGAPNRVQ